MSFPENLSKEFQDYGTLTKSDMDVIKHWSELAEMLHGRESILTYDRQANESKLILGRVRQQFDLWDNGSISCETFVINIGKIIGDKN